MLENKDFFSRILYIEESGAESRNRKVELSKDQEFTLSKQSKLPVTMRVGPFKVQASIHAQARAHQRAGDKSAEEWKEFARKIVKHTETNKIKGGTYMFHSQSENRSVVASVKGREINIVTVFPKGTGGKISHKQLAAGQKSAMMESLVESLMIHPDFQVMLDEAKIVLGHDVDGVQIFDYDQKITEALNTINEDEFSGRVSFKNVDPSDRKTGSIAQLGTMLTLEGIEYPVMIGDSTSAKIKVGDGYKNISLHLEEGIYSFGNEETNKFKSFEVYDEVAARNYGYTY